MSWLKYTLSKKFRDAEAKIVSLIDDNQWECELCVLFLLLSLSNVHIIVIDPTE